ncbi:hypothetical protein CPB84DRAFT_1846534 [Gymnopilus junonius]|uniref:Phytocyanin domain-containing protein n=1 Tax=Gymnopilus junonius TaxID=109634 RepID=A0A9P5TP47_GYMJU|nr:hypothetical protein CPB84DRAFT_1846534 [Gymnopilus junonius]
MVFITPFVGAVALLSGLANGLPRPDSSINEPAVSAPNGTPITASSPSQTGSSSSDMSGSDMSNSAMSSSGSGSGSVNYGGSDSSSSWSSSGSNYGSSSSSNYGSDSSSSNYGSSGDYGSSGNYGGSSWDTTVALATSTSAAWQSYSTPSYGSGTSNWGNSGYNDCVQQCVASYGGLSATATYTPSTTMGSDSSYSGSSGGSGVTHTVIVAPTQGVLRYVPFVVNASVGDTISFMWGANNHTVTKSSELTPCNKTSDSPFTSGEQNKGFMFNQVVNDTNPTFFYCGTPTHCQKGMFGIINPPNALNSPMSVSGMMQTLAANDSNVAAYAAYTDMQTSSNPAASKWGGNIDLTTLPEWSHSLVAENVLFTRNFLAANSETLKNDGSVDLSAAGSTPLMIPEDLSAVLANSPAASSASAATTPAATSAAAAATSAAATAPANAENSTSGAISVSSPKVVVETDDGPVVE